MRPRCVFRVHVASFSSVLRLSRPHRVFCVRIFCASNANAFCWCNGGRHNSSQKDANAKDANAKDANAKDANDANAKDTPRTQKTQRRREFLRILKFKALATKKLTVLPTVFTHCPMHTDADATVFQGRTWSSGKMPRRQVREDAQMLTLSCHLKNTITDLWSVQTIFILCCVLSVALWFSPRCPFWGRCRIWCCRYDLSGGHSPRSPSAQPTCPGTLNTLNNYVIMLNQLVLNPWTYWTIM